MADKKTDEDRSFDSRRFHTAAPAAGPTVLPDDSTTLAAPAPGAAPVPAEENKESNDGKSFDLLRFHELEDKHLKGLALTADETAELKTLEAAARAQGAKVRMSPVVP